MIPVFQAPTIHCRSMKKKRKAEATYLSGQWQDEDEYEITKLRQVVRNHIFKHLKFVKGEGSIPCAKQDRKSKKISYYSVCVTKDQI